MSRPLKIRSCSTRHVCGFAAVVCVALVPLLVAACSFIRFEKGPYVVRDLDVVYSFQEDMTFFVWRLRDDADLDLVEFELYQNGSYRKIDLGDTPYPGKGYECEGNRLCFQFQLRGKYDLPDENVPPLRSHHAKNGYFAGENADLSRVDKTFDVDPVGIAHNKKIDPRRYDWFARKDIPMRRDYQWQFVGYSDKKCGSVGGSGWRSMEGNVAVDYEWVERPRCFASRPVPKKGSAPHVKKHLLPSAETIHEEQTYAPARIKPTTVYGIVVDLSIPSDKRCNNVQNKLLSALESAIEGRGDHHSLGIYRPISANTGKPLSGCHQEGRRRLPLTEMIRDAERATEMLEPPDVNVLWIYINNIELPPDMQIATQLREWTTKLAGENDMEFFNWAIGSNTILAAAPWHHRTGWRPIGDDTLLGDIRSFAKNFLPFSTMKHANTDEIPIDFPPASDDPKGFKICQSTPVPMSAIGVERGRANYGYDDPFVPWPDRGKPFFRIELQPQHLVPHSQYRKTRIDYVVEVCERFCSNPFKTQAGAVYQNWQDTPPKPRPLEVCQWSE